jgi:hypothetical protein
MGLAIAAGLRRTATGSIAAHIIARASAIPAARARFAAAARRADRNSAGINAPDHSQRAGDFNTVAIHARTPQRAVVGAVGGRRVAIIGAENTRTGSAGDLTGCPADRSCRPRQFAAEHGANRGANKVFDGRLADLADRLTLRIAKLWPRCLCAHVVVGPRQRAAYEAFVRLRELRGSGPRGCDHHGDGSILCDPATLSSESNRVRAYGRR